MIRIRPMLSEEQLLSLPHLGKAELVDGRLIVSPAGSEHGALSLAMAVRLYAYVMERRLGRAFDSSTGFWMRGGTLRSPDVAFVAAERLKGMKRLPRRCFQGAPDLAAEILSPNDTPNETGFKVKDYFESGSRMVWVIDPEQRTARIHTPDGDSHVVGADGFLDGGEVVPGFRLRLGDLLDEAQVE
jgi:Uma2 family endonuclease